MSALNWIEIEPTTGLGGAGLPEDLVGCLVKVRSKDGSIRGLLVGDINPKGGLCDCCDELEPSDRVVAWVRVWP